MWHWRIDTVVQNICGLVNFDRYLFVNFEFYWCLWQCWWHWSRMHLAGIELRSGWLDIKFNCTISPIMRMLKTMVMMMLVTQYAPTSHIPTRWESVMMMRYGNMTQSNSHHTHLYQLPPKELPTIAVLSDNITHWPTHWPTGVTATGGIFNLAIAQSVHKILVLRPYPTLQLMEACLKVY